ncbi:glycosyltransferase family 9 protein [Rahnella aceris]|uniref:glycosyltransferase family 9 protein n=1 Tax=Rahnella sp. (strain Y9602) TaxID=2703885 RepID=UPI001C27F7E1|nr:glycosyltransferase family 9 protein [Rahnella aceris]MBU9853187.1 glycosyltransferase family 9 protein [Rahnella aceris]
MSYVIIFILLWPFKMLMKPFHQGKGRNLVIQTAKIGDFVNITPLLKHLKKSDVLISKTVLPLAAHDSTIDSIYLIEDYKKSLVSKIGLAFRLLNRYDNIYLLQPNSVNGFYAAFCNAKHKAFLIAYTRKWYHGIFYQTADVVRLHQKTDFTLESYLKLADPSLSAESYTKHATLPLWIPEKTLPELAASKQVKIGISISAGNKAKTIPTAVWIKILNTLAGLPCQFYVFGPENEQKYLDQLLEKLSARENIINLIGKLKLHEVPHAISQMDMYIASDSGNVYIADAVNIPVVCLAGPCDLTEQHPTYAPLILTPEDNKLVPESFIFSAPYQFRHSAEELFSLSDAQLEKIRSFVISKTSQVQHYV